jgi:hypothetical protein
LETLQMAGPLGSTDITPLRRYYGPGRHLLVFGRLPGVAGYTATGIEIGRAPLQVRGFRSCSFDCKTGSQSHRGLRFPKPPYNPGRPDFPGPV